MCHCACKSIADPRSRREKKKSVLHCKSCCELEEHLQGEVGQPWKKERRLSWSSVVIKANPEGTLP